MSKRIAIGPAVIHRFEVGPPKPIEATSYFAGAAADVVRAALARFRPEVPGTTLAIGYAGVLVEAAGRSILIDGAGTGDPAAASLRRGLAEIGREPEDIDIVVLTHGHEDRVSALTEMQDGSLVPVFSRARHLIHAAELAFFRQSPPAERVGRVYAAAIRPVEEAGLLETASAGDVLADDGSVSVRLEEAPGHAPGHLVVRISAGKETALFASDIFHHPLQTVDARVSTRGDADAARALQTREATIRRCLEDGTIVIGGHFPDSGLGRIVGRPGAVRFEPIA
jgi:glyoxylase-like metal-dependent hydrolase (beta-lactamase superfamily II)